MSFLTGSRAYGTPTKDSDVDLVVLVDDATAKVLHKFTEAANGTVRFGKLNLIVLTSEKEYDAWERATKLMVNDRQKGRPHDRNSAIEVIQKKLVEVGLDLIRSPSETDEDWEDSE